MSVSATGKTRARRSAWLKSSVSAISLIGLMSVSGTAFAQTIINDGDNATVITMVDGEVIEVAAGVTSTVDGAPLVVFDTNDVVLNNAGTLATLGITNTIQLNDTTSGGTVNNLATGQILADSRAIEIDGTGHVINNAGTILGTGNQRNGLIYSDSTAQNFTLNNEGVIDAGEGNEGAGFSAELSAEGNDFTITNSGTIQGRGQASAGAATAGDGLRFERARVDGMLDGSTTGLFTGTIDNSGLIASESTQGTTAGIRFVNGVSFQGVINNSGTISGAQNGVYFGNPVTAGGGDHTGGVLNNLEGGVISSDSRALNIDGLGLTVNNAGDILGTGNQRNGTVYADSTAQNFTFNNLATGVIDAGEGNEGSGFGAEIATDGNTFTLVNDGTIQGRGNASAATNGAGDGIRIGNVGNIGTANVAITNNGLIASEGANGTVAGVRFVNGISFAGTFDNSGTITGVQNGVYFGNPVEGEGGDHSNGVFNNLETGIISSDSRAFNIDGTGLTLNNAGSILGTGNQRNGTIYADSTAQDFTLNNSGLIDAGEGNEGAGFSVELSADGNDFTIINSGTIQGRGQASAGAATAGDGLRFERTRVDGMLDGSTTGLFTGTIDNSGLIASESAQGTAAGIRFVNGVSFQGVINNSGTISGVQNGVYFGNPVPAGGADHTGGVLNNLATGIISSDSRALNIDGIGLTVNNEGSILGTGNQRNGTVYADSTAQNFTLNNSGLIDAGEGNEGSGFGAEIAADGNTFTLINSGTIQGRGNASAAENGAGDGLRIGNVGNIGLATVSITNSGTIASEGANGTVAGVRFVNGIGFAGTFDNSGTITGVQNGVYFGNPVGGEGADHSNGVFNNLAGGVISSDSRAFNIDGFGLTVNNAGSILGTGDQRNGTVYADGTADNFTFNNSGIIDAGEGNQGSGFGVEIGGAADGANTFALINSGTIQGRGNASAGDNLAGDGIRIGNVGNIGVAEATITNTGLIASEGANGTVAGVRFVNGISFAGTFDNSGTITGVQNGVYFGNPVDGEGADHSNGVFNNLSGGLISSDSRAFNIDGLGLTVNNAGTILGTGNQRNGTVYADGTAQNYTFNNQVGGLIDAGEGNEGSGFGAEIGEDGNTFTLVNDGTIQGRGNASAGTNGAGDGVRIGNVGNVGTANVAITNTGLIASEGANGTVGGVRFVNGISFAGTFDNSGTITGVQNGVYFGNPVDGEGADHSNGVFNNLAGGVISSDSRAFNIDGIGLTLNNDGSIIGTGNQRNGTIYADSTAVDFTLNNSGLIDAGEGNEGAGFSVELTAEGNDFTIINSGTIQGRGQASAGAATAGDGLRFERTRVDGMLEGSTTGLFTGDITNSGTIASESTQGTTAGIRFVNGVSFSGTLTNSGTISGAQNGLYFGNPTPAGGGDFTGAIVDNLAGGIISSDSRALNIDGLGLTVNNAGSILGTGDQRNGTVYADGTAEAYTLNNLAGGLIDAGAGNNGSGVSLQSGAVDGETVTFTLDNAGTIAGRGDALPSGASAGLRVFAGAADVTVDAAITNSGTITSETSAAILIEGVNFTQTITNTGTLSGVASFDASTALAGINFVNDGGTLEGDFIGTAFDDTLTFTGTSTLAGSILGGVDTTFDGVTSISGAQTIAGNVISNGTLSFLFGSDSLAVDGDFTFGTDSVVNVITPDDVTQILLNTPVTLVSETGAFTDNGVDVQVQDDDFLVDYATVLGSVTVTATAADLSAVSGDANVSSFGTALTGAFNAGTLDAGVANILNDVNSAAGFETTALGLLPSINEGVSREVFESHGIVDQFVERRLTSGGANGFWATAFGRTADRDAESLSVSGYDASAFGVAIGGDVAVGENLTVGGAFTYTNIDLDDEGVTLEETEIDSFQVSLYAGYQAGQSFFNGQLGYIFGDGQAVRTAATGPINGEFDVDGFTAQATAGHRIENGGFALIPQAGVRFGSVSQDQFTEVGGLGLTVDADTVQYLDLRVGADVTTADAEAAFKPFARAFYVYDAIGDERILNTSFTGAPAGFVLTTGEPAQSRFEVGTGFSWQLSETFSVGVEYDGEFADNYQSHGGFLRGRFAF